MSQVSEIIAAITALALFTKVRYLVAEADPDDVPTELPLCVLSDGGRDFEGLKTFCGGGDLYIQTYEMVILAQASDELDTLIAAVQGALIGQVTLDSTSLTYDQDLRAYSAELTWS